MLTLKKRADFVAASKSPYVWKRPAFVLQLRLNTGEAAPRFGFTVTKKQGNAVLRNRVKRRLREVARLHLSPHAREGCDYVLIGRQSAAEMPFSALVEDAVQSIQRLHHKTDKTLSEK